MSVTQTADRHHIDAVRTTIGILANASEHFAFCISPVYHWYIGCIPSVYRRYTDTEECLVVAQQPVDDVADVDGLPVDGFIAGVGECYERDMVAAELGGGLQKGFCLTTEGLGCINVVSHLYQLPCVALLADHKVNLFASAGGLVVVDIMEEGSGTAQQFYIDDVLQSPAKVVGQQGIGAVGYKARVYNVAFDLTLTDAALEGELVYLHYQECLGQIAHVLLGGDGTAESVELGQLVEVDLLAGIADEVIGNEAQGFNVAQTVALLDVLGDNRLYQPLNVGPLVADAHELWETAVDEIVGEGGFDGGFALGGQRVSVCLGLGAILREGKGVQAYLVVAARQVGGQLTAEQLGIGSCHEDVEACAQQSVHKEVPAIDVLDFVQQNIANVLPIQLIDATEQCVQVGGREVKQTVIVQVGVGVLDTVLDQHLMTDGGLAGATHANDYLSHGTVEFELLFFHAGAPVLDVHLGQFVFLVCQNFEYDVFGHIVIALKIVGKGNKKHRNGQGKCSKMQILWSRNVVKCRFFDREM